MATTASGPPVSMAKDGVRFSAEELAEVDGSGHPVLRIPQSRIRQIGLRWGRQAARPLVQLVLGVALIGGAGFLVISMILGIMRGGVIYVSVAKAVLGTASFALLGAWLLWTALRRGFYLDVQTSSRAEKICFDRRLTREVEVFLDEVRQRLVIRSSETFPEPRRTSREMIHALPTPALEWTPGRPHR